MFEIERPDGSMWSLEGFRRLLNTPPMGGIADLDGVVKQITTLAGGGDLADDLSLVAVEFL